MSDLTTSKSCQYTGFDWELTLDVKADQSFELHFSFPTSSPCPLTLREGFFFKKNIFKKCADSFFKKEK